MGNETEQIDRLFLELSQFTRATTAKELKLERENAELVEALDSIRQFGSDTLSGRVDGPDTREWQRAAVQEMVRRAAEVLAKREAKENEDET